ncbi:MAG: helix-turn-helix domain-containing protein [archaeon]|nr:helix-turn-helix domain-containing protein [archaeon]
MKTKGNVTELTASISEKVLTLMNENNLSARELALRIDVAPKTVLSLISPGESAPSLNVLKSISDYFEVDIAWLIGESSARYLGNVEKGDSCKFSRKAVKNMESATGGKGFPNGFEPTSRYYDKKYFDPESVKVLMGEYALKKSEGAGRLNKHHDLDFSAKDSERFLLMDESVSASDALCLEAAVGNFLLEHWEFVSAVTAYFRSVDEAYSYHCTAVEFPYRSMEPVAREQLLKVLHALKQEALHTMPELCHFFDPDVFDECDGFELVFPPDLHRNMYAKRGPRSRFLNEPGED